MSPLSRKNISLGFVLVAIVLLACGERSSAPVNIQGRNEITLSVAHRDEATGPLFVYPSNPRYFTDGTGKAIYLTGSHTWNNFQDDRGRGKEQFNYTVFLDLLHKHGHNFTKLWVWEQSRWYTDSSRLTTPLPYQRTGPGKARDGDLKFDLTRFNQEYFDRLRARVIAAGERGIYVAVMLFNGWSVEKKLSEESPWQWHPFHRDNNINGIDGDLDRNGEGEETHTLLIPAITTLQEAYVRKVVDTLNDLDNVLWEVSNESHGRSYDWLYHVARYLKDYQSNKPNQHPVGITIPWPGGINSRLFTSPAEWISPVNPPSENYVDNPPPADGTKIVLNDTDHFPGLQNRDFEELPWRSFLRGLHPIFMDPYTTEEHQWLVEPTTREVVRQNLGYTLHFARRMNLAAMTPRSDLASTEYCLTNPGVEYLVYLPRGSHWLGYLFESYPWLPFRDLLEGVFEGRVTVDLSGASGPFEVEWFNPSTGRMLDNGAITGGKRETFTAPFRGSAVLYLKKYRENVG